MNGFHGEFLVKPEKMPKDKVGGLRALNQDRLLNLKTLNSTLRLLVCMKRIVKQE